MKETGIARRIDDLGRIVLPADLRRMFGINAGDLIDVSVDGDAIVLRKVDRACVFCDGVTELRNHRGRAVCASCAEALGRAADPPSSAGEADSQVIDESTGHA